MIKYKGVRHKATLQTVYKTLDRREPFTDIEKAQYSSKEQALIRGIQLRDKENKNQAIQSYTNYQIEGRKATKNLASSLRNYNREHYPKHGQVKIHSASEHERPEKSRKRKATIIKNKKEIKQFLSNKVYKSLNIETYKRVTNASKKYPNAGIFELRHGVNSKASQEWRVKNGLSRNYQ